MLLKRCKVRPKELNEYIGLILECMCFGKAGETEEMAQGRGEIGIYLFFSQSKMCPHHYLSPRALQALEYMDFWCILVKWLNKWTNKWIQSSNEEKKILRPFQWPKFAKVFWAFPNWLSVSFKQIWNLRGSKDYTKELSHRPRQGKRDFFLCLNFWMILMKGYLLVTLYSHYRNQLDPTASGELRMYLFISGGYFWPVYSKLQTEMQIAQKTEYNNGKYKQKSSKSYEPDNIFQASDF